MNRKGGWLCHLLTVGGEGATYTGPGLLLPAVIEELGFMAEAGSVFTML